MRRAKQAAALLAAALALAGGAAIGGLIGKAPTTARAADATGVSIEIGFTEYGGGPVACGDSFTTTTWLAAQVEAKATTPGTGGWQIQTYYGEVGEPVGNGGLYPKFDRQQWERIPLTTSYQRFGRGDWFNQEREEAYVWQFKVWAEGHYLSAFPTGELCEITVTKG